MEIRFCYSYSYVQGKLNITVFVKENYYSAVVWDCTNSMDSILTDKMAIEYACVCIYSMPTYKGGLPFTF